MIDNALVLLSLFWFAVQPIADLADAPIIAGHRLLNELLGACVVAPPLVRE
jgi:hypothetical protein